MGPRAGQGGAAAPRRRWGKQARGWEDPRSRAQSRKVGGQVPGVTCRVSLRTRLSALCANQLSCRPEFYTPGLPADSAESSCPHTWPSSLQLLPPRPCGGDQGEFLPQHSTQQASPNYNRSSSEQEEEEQTGMQEMASRKAGF